MSDITLAELKKNMCKWPIGDPLEKDFHFCGDSRHDEHSYCEKHMAKAYQKSKR